jgi:hypothetical protein
MRTAQLSLVVLLLAFIGLSTSGCGKKAVRKAAEAETGVELLGTRKVTFRSERDTIPVTLFEGTFRAVRIEVEGSALAMWDVDVFFSNGGHQDFPTRVVFEEGSWSRRFDLRGDERGIKKVVFKYKSLRDGSGRATVKLYGIH